MKEFWCNTLTLKIKFHDFVQITRSITQPRQLSSLEVILPLAKQLLKDANCEGKAVRLIGLSVSNPRLEEDEVAIGEEWTQLKLEFDDW